MPYLHWENKTEFERLRSITKLKREQSEKDVDIGDENATGNYAIEAAKRKDWKGTQKLLWTYLDDKHPLHPRRTLYEYHYHYLSNADERHEARKTRSYRNDLDSKSTEVFPMVDQLWMWILPEIGRSPPTVVTGFPQRSNRNGQSKEPKNTALVSSIISRCRELPAKSIYDLAEIISSQCAGIFLDTTNNRHQRLQFAENYATSIGNIVRLGP